MQPSIVANKVVGEFIMGRMVKKPQALEVPVDVPTLLPSSYKSLQPFKRQTEQVTEAKLLTATLVPAIIRAG